MSPIVYIPPRPHDCEPPRQGEKVESPDEGRWYPELTLWECEKCYQCWELIYDLHRVWNTSSCHSETYSYFYYEVNWRRVYH